MARLRAGLRSPYVLVLALWILAAAVLSLRADVVTTSIPRTGGAAGGGAASLVSGTTGVTGCQNLVLYGNNSNVLECEAAFGYATASNTLDVDTANVDTLDVDTAATVTLGTGTGKGSIGGVICKGAPNAATTGTVEEVLATCPLPASTLTAAGSTLVYEATLKTAANGNNKQLRVRVGGLTGTIVEDTGATTSNNLVWSTLPCIVRRTGATTASVVCRGFGGADGGGAVSNYATQMFADDSVSITWANSNDLVVTGTTATAAGDLTLVSYHVEVKQ